MIIDINRDEPAAIIQHAEPLRLEAGCHLRRCSFLCDCAAIRNVVGFQIMTNHECTGITVPHGILQPLLRYRRNIRMTKERDKDGPPGRSCGRRTRESSVRAQVAILR